MAYRESLKIVVQGHLEVKFLSLPLSVVFCLHQLPGKILELAVDLLASRLLGLQVQKLRIELRVSATVGVQTSSVVGVGLGVEHVESRSC